jgi:hypothetical protein
VIVARASGPSRPGFETLAGLPTARAALLTARRSRALLRRCRDRESPDQPAETSTLAASVLGAAGFRPGAVVAIRDVRGGFAALACGFVGIGLSFERNFRASILRATLAAGSRPRRRWAGLDLLLTCETITEARDKKP